MLVIIVPFGQIIISQQMVREVRGEELFVAACLLAHFEIVIWSILNAILKVITSAR